MAWDFSTEPEFQEKLDWMDRFVREEVEPLDLLFSEPGAPYNPNNEVARRITAPLKRKVKEMGLWACHLGPELGGKGYGQVKLALMNEILGRSMWAPSVFGCQAPDSGNAEILAHYGTEEQKRKYLEPLLEGEIVSCYSMTEPHAGSDPKLFRTRAVRDGDEWVINGTKWFSSNARFASFLIVMAVTNPDVSPYKGMSMFLVPTDTPGLKILRNVGLMTERPEEGTHAYLQFDDVRVPAENLLGPEGAAFEIAQTRLGGGRIHHAMRTVGMCQKAFDMMCERVLSRETQGSLLAEKQSVQNYVADSWIELQQFRLLVLHTAWLIDRGEKDKARTQIAAVKVATARILHDIVFRSMHVHGALGVSNEMPFGRMWMAVPVMGIVDGPTEVHRVTVARRVLRHYKPSEGLFPSEHIPTKLEAARKKFAQYLEHEVANL
ncbi:MAG: acyl-CoA dehydrogenase [Candidatus Binatia bacterium]|nr:MAG: acyl-CoA dehydrogenase [Candidatus Binatia bacterium]